MVKVNVQSDSAAGRATAKKILDGSSSSSSSSGSSGGSSSGGGSSGSSTSNTSQQTKIVDLTKEAESKKLEPVKNKSNDYTQYWEGTGENERRITGNTPEVRIYISRQKTGAGSMKRDIFQPSKLIQDSELLSNSDIDDTNTAVYKTGDGKEVLVHQSIDKIN